MVVSNDYQGTVSKRSGCESVMDSDNIAVADAFPCLYGTYRIFIGQSKACKIDMSSQISRK